MIYVPAFALPSLVACKECRRVHQSGRWALIGFLLGAALPVGYGIYSVHQFRLYVASLPPNTIACGNAVLGAFVLILVVGPFFGMIGAAFGWLAAAMLNGAKTIDD